MALKQLLILSFLFPCVLFSQIDSLIFDLDPFYRKLGVKATFRIIDFNFIEQFCVLKANDSSEYIVKPNSVHGPFKKVSNIFHNNSLFEIETMQHHTSTYSTTFKNEHFSLGWAEVYDPLYNKSVIFFNDKQKKYNILQQDGIIYGSFENTPNLLWSDNQNTIYQVFKNDRKHFELFKNKRSLGKYHLSDPIGKIGNTDNEVVYTTLFKDLWGRNFAVQKDSLFGPLKTVRNIYFNFVDGSKSYDTHLIQYPKDNFCRLIGNKKEYPFQLTADATYYYLFPDSSLIFKAEFLKKYKYLRNKEEICFYHTKFGLIDPPPIKKKDLKVKNFNINILSNTLFYMEGFYGENLSKIFLYKGHKFIDTVNTIPSTIINDNYFYIKNGEYMMNGKPLNIPENIAFCVYHTDTFYVIKTGVVTWNLYKNGVKQITVPVTVKDNIRGFHFVHYPTSKQLILYINTGYEYNDFAKACPNKCYSHPYDIYKNKLVKVDYNNSERDVSLYGERKYIIDYWTHNTSFTIKDKTYPQSIHKNVYYDNGLWYLFLNVTKKQLTLYSVKSN